MPKTAKVTKRATAVAVTKSLSRRSSSELHLTGGQRRAILENKGKKRATAG